MEILIAAVVLFLIYKIFFGKGAKKKGRDAIIGAAARLGVPEPDATRILDASMSDLSQLLAATALPQCTISNLPAHERMAHCVKIVHDKSQNSVSNKPTPPSDAPKPHFYIRGISGEVLNTPIHIHFDSFRPALKVDQKALLSPGSAFDYLGTFLVTQISPNSRPKGLTCRVSGVNHKLSRRGMVDGIIAHVEMVRDVGEGPIERVYVNLHEDGSTSGITEISDGCEEVNLEEVDFSYGDTVFLDGDGNPFDDMNKPQPTERQKLFRQQDKEKIASNLSKTLSRSK